jgi:protein involved in polysaccharide export with SLBB domain
MRRWIGSMIVLGLLVAGVVAPTAADIEVIKDDLAQSYLQEMQRVQDMGDVVETPEIYAPTPTPAPVIVPVGTLTDSSRAMRGQAGMTAYTEYGQPPVDPSEVFTSAQVGDDSLQLFGFDFFRAGAAAFQEIEEVPVPSDYRLGPGDKVIINLWGRVDKTYNLTVDREGKIFIPEAGAMTAWGQTLEEFEGHSTKVLERVYSDFEINVMMGRVRSMRVYVLGEAKQTGAYTVSALSTFMNVLHQAGGPTERGSLRRLRLMRGGRIHKTIDLYEMLLHGEGATAVNLQSNDAIFVPVIGPTVAVRGEVKRPAIYELVGGETVEDVIELAGGMTAEAYSHRVQITRVDSHGDRGVIDVDLTDESLSTMTIADGDAVELVAVDLMIEKTVELSGWVKYPGTYALRPGMHISDLLREGDVLRPDSYLPRAVIRRRLPDGTHQLIPVNLNRLLGHDDRYGALGQSPGLLAATDGDYLGGPSGSGDGSSSSFREAPYYGTGTTLEADPELQPLDELTIYSAEEMGWRYHVTIDGHVRSPGRYDLTRGMRLSDLIFEAGGIDPQAYQARAEIVRIDESGRNQVLAVDLEQLLGHGDETVDLELEREDAVYVRKTPDRREPEKVVIEGEVRFPGPYSLTYPGERLSEVLARCGGPTEYAFLEGAVYIRESIVQDVSRQGLDKIFMSFQVDSTTGIPMHAAPWLQRYEPEFVASGRVAIDLPKLLATGDPQYDVVLQDGDTLIIPRKPSEVPVTGYVASSGAIHYVPGKDVAYYLDRSGGVTPSGDKGGVRLVRANGQVIQASGGTRVELGDAVMVPPRNPRDGETLRWLRDFSMSMLGVAATVFIVSRVN